MNQSAAMKHKTGVEEPFISVLTPSLNYGTFITDSVLSVRHQTGVTVEHIVQDACSTDSTRQAIASSGCDVVWSSEKDTGQSDALNKALGRARGEWIAWLNADEFYLPSALRVLSDAALRHGADVVYGDVVFVNEKGELLRLAAHHAFHPFFLKWYGCYVMTCCTLFRREALSSEPWDTSLRLTMDWDLYLRLARAGARFLYVKYPVAAFRIHEGQVIGRPISEFSEEFDLLWKRHGVRAAGIRRFGRWPHDLYKLFAGAYQRQFQARRLRGHDLRWFSSPASLEACSLLQEGRRRVAAS